ncbi:MAG: hypothetical protein HY403_01760 [Elusimicrobia bacterium]|nr:hypothetical protein [Elusimicrobiota bacterium]
MTLAFPPVPALPAKPWKREFTGYDSHLTAESLAAYRAAWQQYEQAVRDWRAACDEIAGAAARLLIAEGFPAEVKAWTRSRTKGRITRALNVALRDFGPTLDVTPSLWLHDEEDWLRRADQRERQAQQAIDAAALRDRAIVYLLGRGKVYGQDFTAETAEEHALEIAARERITELRKAEPWHSFNGQNCGDYDETRDCKGWDGESRRCQCGNRRVSWEIEGTFEAPRVYGEAY